MSFVHMLATGKNYYDEVKTAGGKRFSGKRKKKVVKREKLYHQG